MKKFFFLSFIIFTIPSVGQNVKLASSQLVFNLLPATLSYQAKLNETISSKISTGIGYTAGVSSSDGFSALAIPITYASVRKYYARNRVKKDDLRKNSGNYFGFFGSYQWEPFGQPSGLSETILYLEISNVYTAGLVWGIERNYSSGFHLGLSIGPGFIGGEFIKEGFTMVGEFELGYVLFSK